MRSSLTPARRLAVLAAAFALAAGAAGAALADGPEPPGGGAAVDQYREQIPTSGGSVAPRGQARGARPLAPSVAAALRSRGGADARALERIATSSDLGAPQRPLRSAGRVQDTGPGPVGAALSAVGASAAGSDGGGRLVGVLAAMLAIALLGVVAAARRRASSV